MEDLNGSDDGGAVNAILSELEKWSQSVSEDTFLRWCGTYGSYQPHILDLSRWDALVTQSQRAAPPLHLLAAAHPPSRR